MTTFNSELFNDIRDCREPAILAKILRNVAASILTIEHNNAIPAEVADIVSKTPARGLQEAANDLDFANKKWEEIEQQKVGRGA